MKNEGTLFSVLGEVDVPESLPARIRARIAHIRQQRARLKTLLLGISSLVFGLSLVPAFQYAGQEFYSSGFYEYSSLLFSDGGFIASAWRQFALSLIESIPSLALLLVLLLCTALAWSLRRTFVNARTAFSF